MNPEKPIHVEKPRVDVWRSLQGLTQARIAIGRTGDSLPTSTVLDFEIAQAQARDAVHQPLDVTSLAAALAELGLPSVALQSRAADRKTYLRRPDLGRRLSDVSREQIRACNSVAGVAVVIADGLSAAAPAKHAAPMIAAMIAALLPHVVVCHPIFIATQARVALGDEIGELIGAEAVLVLIGERPGLSTPASLGAYLTWRPRVGRTDAERNCVSNIHAHGLSYAAAARKLDLLLQGARKLGATGVDLHDEADETMRLR